MSNSLVYSPPNPPSSSLFVVTYTLTKEKGSVLACTENGALHGRRWRRRLLGAGRRGWRGLLVQWCAVQGGRAGLSRDSTSIRRDWRWVPAHIRPLGTGAANRTSILRLLHVRINIWSAHGPGLHAISATNIVVTGRAGWPLVCARRLLLAQLRRSLKCRGSVQNRSLRVSIWRVDLSGRGLDRRCPGRSDDRTQISRVVGLLM